MMTTDRTVYNIATSDEAEPEQLKRVKAVTEVQLHLALGMEGQINGNEWRKTLALAKTEFARRQSAEAKKLTRTSTIWAAAIAGAAGIVGTAVGAMLSGG